MSNKVSCSIDDLSNEIMKALKDYKEDITEDVKELSNQIIKEARNELKQISPRASKNVYTRKGSISGKKGDVITPRKLCKIMEYKKWKKD